MRSFVVAIDGPAAAGKGTLAKALAQRFSFDALDTGLLYRAVGRALLDAGADPSNEPVATAMAQKLTLAQTQRADLRGETVGQAASICSGIAGVRQALLNFQLDFAARPPGGFGALLDGRDIGTAVCPDAQVKLWITASPLTRAARRHAEAVAAGDRSQTVEQIAASIAQRDERERNRPISPLLPADDALRIDTSDLSLQEVFDLACERIESALLAHRARFDRSSAPEAGLPPAFPVAKFGARRP